MSDPRFELPPLDIDAIRARVAGGPNARIVNNLCNEVERLRRVDAVSSQYEEVAHFSQHWFTFDKRVTWEQGDKLFRRIEHSADTRALIDNRTPAETADAKAWSDDAHARIRAGEVSGSHDLMREKVGEYDANTQTRCRTCFRTDGTHSILCR